MVQDPCDPKSEGGQITQHIHIIDWPLQKYTNNWLRFS